MPLTIEAHSHHLRVLVQNRTPEDLAQLAGRIFEAASKHQLARVLICVEASDAIFAVGRLNLEEYLDRVAKTPGLKIALVADSSELYASHQYMELLASQRGVRMKAFRDEKKALEWLHARRGNAPDGGPRLRGGD